MVAQYVELAVSALYATPLPEDSDQPLLPGYAAVPREQSVFFGTRTSDPLQKYVKQWLLGLPHLARFDTVPEALSGCSTSPHLFKHYSPPVPVGDTDTGYPLGGSSSEYMHCMEDSPSVCSKPGMVRKPASDFYGMRLNIFSRARMAIRVILS